MQPHWKLVLHSGPGQPPEESTVTSGYKAMYYLLDTSATNYLISERDTYVMHFTEWSFIWPIEYAGIHGIRRCHATGSMTSTFWNIFLLKAFRSVVTSAMRFSCNSKKSTTAKDLGHHVTSVNKFQCWPLSTKSAQNTNKTKKWQKEE